MIEEPESVAKLHRTGPRTCIQCGSPMPPIKPKGRVPIYCSGACRKAAYEARRLQKPTAFEVRVVETRTVADHPLSACVENALKSPKAHQRMLQNLASLIRNDQMNDPKWDVLDSAFVDLQRAIRDREVRRARKQEESDRLLREREASAMRERQAQVEKSRQEVNEFRRKRGLPPLEG